MNAVALPAVIQSLTQYESAFNTQNGFGLKFETECLFAKQQLMKNDYTLSVAEKNQASLKSAILNVAAIGISLNPATAHAYLVPRDNAICLDMSYRGLVKLATDCGAIAWAKAELVYEGDQFEWNGMTQLPAHNFDPFDPARMNAANPMERLRGGYCVAQLADGTYLIDRMTAGEIEQVRNSSKGYASGKKSPWNGKWAGEMAKKTLVKRASKSWPQSNERDRLDRAIEILNESEGLDLEQAQAAPAVDCILPEQAQAIREALTEIQQTEEAFCRSAGIHTLEALAAARFNGAMAHLNSYRAKLQGAAQ